MTKVSKDTATVEATYTVCGTLKTSAADAAGVAGKEFTNEFPAKYLSNVDVEKQTRSTYEVTIRGKSQ